MSIIPDWISCTKLYGKMHHGHEEMTVVVVVSGMQLLRLRSAIRRHHPPQRAVLSQICCFGSVRWCFFRSCWTVLSHVMRGRRSCLLQSAGGEANRILLASALSSMRIICPNRVSRRNWMIAVSLGWFVSLRASSFRTNWYHLMPSTWQAAYADTTGRVHRSCVHPS